MKAVFATLALAAVSNADMSGHGHDDKAMSMPDKPNINEIFTGTYEFEILGRQHKIYVCDARMGDGLFMAVSDTHYDHHDEYTIALGRDPTGARHDDKMNSFISDYDIYRLFGDRVLQGEYQIVFDEKTYTYRLRERFPDFEKATDGSNEAHLWNQYDLVKVSPAIVGNPEMQRHQCYQPDPKLHVPNPSLWKSDWNVESGGFIWSLIKDDTACWKLEDRYLMTFNAGYNYGIEFAWDDQLVIMRWDSDLDHRAPTYNEPCEVGSQFWVMLDDKLAMSSVQCADQINGYQSLVYLQTDSPKALMKYECPFTIDPYPKPLQFPMSDMHHDSHDDHQMGGGGD